MSRSEWEQAGVDAGGWITVGGHRNAEGEMRAYRTPGGWIVKATDDGHNVDALRNEAAMLAAMAGTGFAPTLVGMEADVPGGPLLATVQTDAGVSEPIVDGERFRRNMIRLVGAIRERGLRHGDLTAPNLIVRDDRAIAIDWQEAHPLAEPGPQKQPWSDSFMAMRDVAETTDVDGQADTPRVARRWMAVLRELGAVAHEPPVPLAGKTFIDLGCYIGDFPALAAVEGMDAWGIDSGGFRTGENSIQVGNELWHDLLPRAPTLVEADVFEWVDVWGGGRAGWDVAMMFSTFPYLVQQRGWEAAERLVGDVAARSGAFFFECQLAGDGPGPDRFRTDDDVGRWLGRFGSANALATIPVTGRPASRTVFVVRTE